MGYKRVVLLLWSIFITGGDCPACGYLLVSCGDYHTSPRTHLRRMVFFTTGGHCLVGSWSLAPQIRVCVGGDASPPTSSISRGQAGPEGRGGPAERCGCGGVLRPRPGPFLSSGSPGRCARNESLSWVLEGSLARYLRPVILLFSAESDPGTPRSPGPAPHMHLHEKLAPDTYPEAVS